MEADHPQPQSIQEHSMHPEPIEEHHQDPKSAQKAQQVKKDVNDKKEQQHHEQSPIAKRKESYMKAQDIKGRIMSDIQFYFKFQIYSKVKYDFLNAYSIIPSNHPDRLKFSDILIAMRKDGNFNPTPLGLSITESRGTAAVLGMAVSDALGASTQFEYFNKKGLGIIKKGFSDIKTGRHGKIGIWTDDASMGLSMADSLLLNDYHFEPIHFRYLFTLWLRHGLNNGGRPHSIGLGGNISISMDQFMHEQRPFTATQDQFNNGNGSLMRLAPLPIAFSDQPQKAIQYSGEHSLTTHNGIQAAQCCRLMANILVALINRPEGKDGKQTIEQVCENFATKVKSVEYLAKSKCQTQQMYEQAKKANKKFKAFNKSVNDRNWNWKDQNFTYAPTRLKKQPGYIGSYCMDALSMALHTVWFSKNWKNVAIVNADMGGDCDTVGSIAGQIAGALYGIEPELLELYSEMPDYKEGKFQAFLKGYLLSSKKNI